MNRLFTLVLLFAVTLSSYAKWNATTCSYTDHKWHFHWNLDQALEWEKKQPNEPHTIFKAVSPYGAMAYVNINPFTAPNQDKWDLWEHFDDYKIVLEESWQKVEERTGAEIIPLKLEKCRFFGENAVKVLVGSIILDDVHDESSYSLTYTFHKDGATWSATVMVSPEVWKLVGEEGLKDLFVNFGPNAK